MQTTQRKKSPSGLHFFIVIGGTIAIFQILLGRNTPDTGDLLIISSTLAILSIVNLALIYRKTINQPQEWTKVNAIQINGLALFDTVLIASGVLYFASKSAGATLLPVLLISFTGLSLVVGPFIKNGISSIIHELVAFYASESVFDVFTGKVPHSRIHPPHEGHDDLCKCGVVEKIQIRTFFDLVGYIFVMFPRVFHIIWLKSSAIILGPLLYIGLSFNEQNYEALTLEAKRTWRSSFKPLWLTLSLISLGTRIK